jgi:hypothetical protein
LAMFCAAALLGAPTYSGIQPGEHGMAPRCWHWTGL